MNAVSAIEPWQGKVVEGKYPLLELIGTGPSGPVFRTELSASDGRKPAAIKLIPVEAKNVQAELSRLVLSRALSHPNLTQIFDAGQCEIRRQPAIYVVTEFAEENLAQILPSRPLASGEVEQMLPPLIDALSYLHRNGFVHGRVQPSNVMAVADTLKLSSDSIQKIEDPVSQNPPQKNSVPAANDPASASDVRALGALLVAALAPETRGQPSEQQLTLLPGSIPEPFRRIARECLRPNPADRCTLEQIKDWINTKQVSSTPTAREIDAATGAGSRVKRIGIPVAVLVVLVGIVIALNSRSKVSKSAAPESVQTAPVSQVGAQPATQRGGVSGAVAERVQPNISQGARNTIQGKIRVAVRLSVDSAGNVTDAKLTTPGPSKYFANQALQSARKWRFTPPQINGQPTASAWLLKYQFGRGGTEILPSEIH